MPKILVTFWSHFGNLIKNCVQNVPIDTFSRSAEFLLISRVQLFFEGKVVQLLCPVLNDYDLEVPVEMFRAPRGLLPATAGAGSTC